MKNLRSTEGFSLVEMGVVVALVALVAGLGLIGWGSFANLMMRVQVDRLYATCLYMGRRAQITHKPETLTFNLAGQSYTFCGQTYTLGPYTQFGSLPGAQGPPSLPTKTITKPITFADTCITFYPHGSISAGTVYFVDTQHQSLYALSCAVSPVAHIRRYRYEGHWRMLV